MADGIASLANALAQAQARSRASNPLYPMAQGIMGLDFRPSETSRSDSIKNSLIQGIAAGLFQGFGDMYQESQNDLINEGVRALATGSELPSGLSESVFSPINNAYSLFSLDRAIDVADEKRKYDAALNNAVMSQAAGAIAQNPEAADSIIAGIGKLKNPSATAEIQAQQIAERSAPAELTDAQKEEKDPYGLGPTLQNKFDAAMEAASQQGLKGAAKLEYAKRLNETDLLRNKESGKRVEEAFRKAALLDELANTAEAGVSGAGETGGFFGPIRDVASQAYAVFNPEERAQRASQSTLESIGPEIVKAGRSPGAVSDIEMKMLVGSGPSSSNTPEQNTALIERMKGIAGAEREYASFLEAMQGTYGHTRGVENLWAKYKAANPIYIKKDDGTFEINRSRSPWQQFDFSAAAVPTETKEPKTESSKASGSSGSGIPAVGGTFNGEKVLSVKKVR